MIAPLQDRAEALVRVGRARREAERPALVCLPGGVLLRSQHLAFIGRTNPAPANRFVRRCRKHAVEQPCNGTRLRVCRRPAAPEVVLRRLLSLDYVLEHPCGSRPRTRTSARFVRTVIDIKLPTAPGAAGFLWGDAPGTRQGSFRQGPYQFTGRLAYRSISGVQAVRPPSVTRGPWLKSVRASS